MKWTSWGLALVFAVSGCALWSGPVPGPDRAPSGDCVASPERARRFDRPLVVALTEPVTAENAPLPADESEYVVFSQLYETLVTLDCKGKVRPGLARSWSVSRDGREWTFRLRENARFSNGARLLAENVREAWELLAMRYTMSRVPRVPLNPWTWVSPESVRSVGEDVVVVSLAESLGDEPVVFAHPALSVIKRSSYLGWPLGSGPYLLSMADAKEIALIPNRFAPEDLRARSPLTFRMRPGEDPRDVLADKPDAILVRAASGVEYALRLPDYGRSLEGGERTYYLLSGNVPLAALDTPDYRRSLDGLRTELAQDVVLSGARPLPPEVGPILPATPGIIPSRPQPAPMGAPPLAYPEEDGDAERIAERLVGSAAAPPGSGDGEALLDPPADGTPAAYGLEPWAFESLLRSGAAWGYVVSLRSDDPLFDREEPAFFESLPWFLGPRTPLRNRGGTSGPQPGVAALPLLRVTTRLVLRDGVNDVVADGVGTFRFRLAGRGEEPEEP